MIVDAESVLARLDYIREQVSFLQPLVEDPLKLEDMKKDPYRYKGVLYMLQTSIEAMMDIAYHLCAKLYATAPENGSHAFEILAEHGDIPQEKLATLRKMVHFRNLVAHGYLHTDPGMVARIIGTRLGDFMDWEIITRAILTKNLQHNQRSNRNLVD